MSRKREKIIEELKELKSFLSDSYGETLDYAIESMKVDLTYDLLYEQVESDSKKESCNDCISRQAAINALGECPMNWTDSDAEITAERDWKDTVEMLKNLPSVTPHERWIPVSEKLPEEDGEYLCTIQIHNGTRVVRMTSFAKDLYAIDNFDFYDKKGKAGWFDYDDGGYYEVSDVIAWDEKFKLPQPYEEKEEKK